MSTEHDNSTMKTVSKEEFFDFINKYPRTLESGCTTICFPEIYHYFDKTLTDKPVGSIEAFFEMIVAQYNFEYDACYRKTGVTFKIKQGTNHAN